MGDLRFPSWEKPFREALVETDLNKLLEKIHAKEGAMFVRWQELASSNDEHVEREAMRAATEELLKLKSEKLKWPSGNLTRSFD